MLKIIASPHIKLDSKNWCFPLSMSYLLDLNLEPEDLQHLHERHVTETSLGHYLPQDLQEKYQVQEKRSEVLFPEALEIKSISKLLAPYLITEEKNKGYLIFITYPQAPLAHCITIKNETYRKVAFSSRNEQDSPPFILLNKFRQGAETLFTPVQNHDDIAHFLLTELAHPTEIPTLQIVKYASL